MVYSSITRDIKGSRSAHISQLQTERENKKKKSPESTAKIQKCVLVIFNSHHQHSKTLPEMSPFQIISASALLLTCVYLPLGTPMPVTARVIKRTGTEAINAKVEIDNYLKDTYGNKDLDVKATCSSLLHHIVLPCPQNVSGCNSMVNVSKNLNYLLHLYSHVLGFIYQRSTDETQMVKLDYLEMIYHRFYNQMQRYLQVHNLSHGDTKCIEQEDIHGNITALQVDITDIEIAEVILCHLRDMAFSTMHMLGEENSLVRGYKFCRILPDLQQLCITGSGETDKD